MNIVQMVKSVLMASIHLNAKIRMRLLNALLIHVKMGPLVWKDPIIRPANVFLVLKVSHEFFLFHIHLNHFKQNNAITTALEGHYKQELK